MQTAMLAGYYNIHWSQLENSIAICGTVQIGADPHGDLTRILVPIRGPATEPVGALAVYTDNGGDYQHAGALDMLAQDISTVILGKQQRADKKSGPAPAASRRLGDETAGGKPGDNVLDLLRATIDNFPGGICVLSSDLTVAMTNKRFYEILTLPEALFPAGSNFGDILRFNAARGEYGQGDVEQLAQERIRHAKLFVDHAFDRDTASGLVLEVRSTPSPGGGCVLTYVDVTARKMAERELLHHRDRLEEIVTERTAEIELQAKKLERLLNHERHVNEQQRQFVAMASHEFRTPLAIIDGAAQRLMRRKSEVTPEFVGEKVGQIRGSVSRMVDLMESILAVGRLDHGMIDIRPEPCAIADLIRLCAASQRDITPSHRFNLDLEHLPAMISADRSALQQVVTNLLSNAVKYAPNSPEIDVRGWQENGSVHVSVRDRGIGIDADDLPKMFQRYFRARTSTGIAGTGIGLSLVQQIVELHRGTLSVTSEKGQGSIFTISLPFAATEKITSDIHKTEAA
ncbi:histidine kinase [Agrobacterium vitis]|uniref:histidine kinase n=4 Tax=Agrobacterium vitis TaxID=373 RepID=A0ABD6G9Q7_AGRVI|nr:histidine kinase [Agrobacterium vitis]MUO94671.1 histidine kinase [Agrobacterium vitis]MUP05567.1 histidine kinase [Agrobacterium vitis]MUZ81439.1 histidine kinase [Agrobacterium vitis]MVA22488.1 histidine kinase [Agrobacterium vitis]